MHIYGILAWATCAEANLDLYDIWDNRQFPRTIGALRLLSGALGELGLSESELDRATTRLNRLCQAGSFEEMYAIMGARYFVDANAALADFGVLESKAYDVIFSIDVLEHVGAGQIDRSIGAMARLLKPGGISIHQIGLGDHLSHYDRHSSRKQFLSYGEREWRLRFENAVQYTNLVPFDDFKTMFVQHGFKELLADTKRWPHALNGLVIHERFRRQSQESLECVRGYIVHENELIQP
jgi:hypothetical protein